MKSYAYNQIKSRSLYKKVGEKYIRCSTYDEIDRLYPGWYLLHVKDGGSSMRSIVHPERAEVHAAMMLAEEAMVKAMLDASKHEFPHGHKPLSKKAQKLWLDLQRELNTETLILRGKSYHDIVQAGIKVLE